MTVILLAPSIVFQFMHKVDRECPSRRITALRSCLNVCRHCRQHVLCFGDSPPAFFRSGDPFTEPLLLGKLFREAIDHLLCHLHAMFVRPVVFPSGNRRRRCSDRSRRLRRAGDDPNGAKSGDRSHNARDYPKSFVRHLLLRANEWRPYHARCRPDLFVSANLLLFPATAP
jgi:hypothetical protein